MEEYAAFTDSELNRIALILRAAFDISTSNGEEDELLGDFIQALDDRVPIVVDDEEENNHIYPSGPL